MQSHYLCPVMGGKSLGEEGDAAGRIYPSCESQQEAYGGEKAIVPSKGEEGEGQDETCMPKNEKFPGTKPSDQRPSQNKSKAISDEDEGEDTPRAAVGYSEFRFYRGQDGRENGS